MRSLPSVHGANKNGDEREGNGCLVPLVELQVCVLAMSLERYIGPMLDVARWDKLAQWLASGMGCCQVTRRSVPEEYSVLG
eukprot:3749855-Amphidinium_carterae.2